VNFILSVAASVIAGVLLALVVGLRWERARWILTASVSRLVDIDVDYVFPSPRAAQKDVQEELHKAQFVRLLTGRGNELQRETFAEMLSGQPSRRKKDIRILLPCTEHAPATIDWVQDREDELATFDPAYGGGTLRSQIRATATFLLPLAHSVQVRRYDFPHIGRIIVTDRCAYFTPYQSGAHGRDSRVVKFRRNGEMYDFLNRTFLKVWAASRDDVTPPKEPGAVTGSADNPKSA
jgi:hypothetical protein